MKMIRNFVICLAAVLFAVPLANGQDLSKYRIYSLGASLTDISKLVSEKPADATVLHQSPALIQELTCWPVQSYQAPAPSEPVQEILFSFYNGALYKMVVNYRSSATEGLTPEDMVRAISAQYGAATAPVADPNPPAIVAYSNTEEAIAFWEDSQYSLTLSRSPLSQTFQLVMFSKRVNGQAEAAIAEAVKQARENAPQREIARAQKEAENLETLRQTNLKAFRL